MTAAELETFYREKIPLAAAMDLRVASLDPCRIHLTAPLAPNRNDKLTAFGGSIASLLLLAGWGLLHATLGRSGMASEIVIHRCEFLYDRPVGEQLHARCALPEATPWDAFLGHLERRGRGRVALTSELDGAGQPAATMQGRYVAQLKAPVAA